MKQIFTEMKGINIEAAIHVKSSLALSRCQLSSSKSPSGQRGNSMLLAEQVPIAHLTEEHIDGLCDGTSSAQLRLKVTFPNYGYLLLTFVFFYF